MVMNLMNAIEMIMILQRRTCSVFVHTCPRTWDLQGILDRWFVLILLLVPAEVENQKTLRPTDVSILLTGQQEKRLILSEITSLA